MIHCVLFINTLSCHFIFFFLEGRGSRKRRFVTKKLVSNQALQAVTEGVGGGGSGQNSQYFRYVLIERPLIILAHHFSLD